MKGKSTKRSTLDAEHLTAKLRRCAVEQLAQSEGEELWIIADGSDLRKPYATEMPALMKVRDLNRKLVPGHRTLNVLGITPQRWGILYQLFFFEPGGSVHQWAVRGAISAPDSEQGD